MPKVNLLMLWLAVSAPAPAAYADTVVLTADEFESHAAGEPLPKVAAEGRGGYGYGTADGEIRVHADPQDGQNQVVRLHKPAARGGSYLDVFARSGTCRTFGELLSSGRTMVVSYDLYVSGANTGKCYATVRGQAGMDNLATLYFTPASDGEFAVSYAVAGEAEASSGKRILPDQWHHVVYEMRPVADGGVLFTAQITSRSTGETRVVAEGIAVPIQSADNPSMNRLRFYQFGSPAGENHSYVDNISIAYRPAGAQQTASESKAPAPQQHIEESILVEPQPGPAPAEHAASDAYRVLEQTVITDARSGYVAWPTAAVLPGGDVLVVASGGRVSHACPFGKCYLYRSADQGRTWQGPLEVWDGKLDDRDSGLFVTSKGTVLANWFTSVAWLYHFESDRATPAKAEMLEYGKTLTLEDLKREGGFWMLRSVDGGKTWSDKYRVPVATPHGPCELRDGSLLYVGYEGSIAANMVGGRPSTGGLVAARSEDDGQTWNIISRIPVLEGHRSYQYHEPHAVQADDGTIIAHIRKNYPKEALTLQVTSTDSGYTWSDPEEVYWGFPSHLAKLGDGRILATYGYRRAPIGIRARISADNGKTWGEELVLYHEAVSGDMGYPSTVQLADRSLLTVWYERGSDTKCVLKSLRWELTK